MGPDYNDFMKQRLQGRGQLQNVQKPAVSDFAIGNNTAPQQGRKPYTPTFTPGV